MPFDFLHRPSRNKEQRPWYENVLLLGVAGSIIAVVGQLAGTVIPIMYGSQDVSDFSISINPISVLVDPPAPRIHLIEVVVNDLHEHLRPYKFGILLKALDVPPGVTFLFQPHEIQPGEVSRLTILLPKNVSSLMGKHQITIQGVGADGKKRNTTLYLYSKDVNNNITTSLINDISMAFDQSNPNDTVKMNANDYDNFSRDLTTLVNSI